VKLSKRQLILAVYLFGDLLGRLLGRLLSGLLDLPTQRRCPWENECHYYEYRGRVK
jgi:hypothetical protein